MNENGDITTLVKQSQKGHIPSFEQLVVKYSNQIYNLALRILGDEHEAQDVVQDTFLAAYEKIDTFNFNSHFYTWLYRIATNFALMKIRKHKNMPVSESDFEHHYEVPFEESAVSNFIKADDYLVNKELREKLEEAINQLPPIYKTVFILRDLEELSIKETAEILSITESNVKIRLKRARIFLKEYLEKVFADEV